MQRKSQHFAICLLMGRRAGKGSEKGSEKQREGERDGEREGTKKTVSEEGIGTDTERDTS